MFGVLTTGTTVFAQNELFGSISFVAFGNIVEMPAFGAF